MEKFPWRRRVITEDENAIEDFRARSSELTEGFAREEAEAIRYMNVRGRLVLTLIAFSAILLACILVSCALGPADISPLEVGRMLAYRIPWAGKALVRPNWPASHEVIVFGVRLPRILLGAVVGASLSVAGVGFQGLLRNPLADPYIIGVSAGAALGASLSIVFGLGDVLLGGIALGIGAVPVVAFIFAIGTMVVVYNLARVGGRLPAETFLLSGVVVGSFLWALVSFIMTVADKGLHEVVFWLMGSLSGRGMGHVMMALPYALLGIVGLFAFARDLNLLALGEEPAQHLGLDAEKFKVVVILLAALMTAAAVSVSGIIGFVGLMVPHIIRLILGPDHRILLPASALGGAAFLIMADTIARNLLAPTEIPVGVITAILGGPFFAYLLRKRKKGVMFGGA